LQPATPARMLQRTCRTDLPLVAGGKAACAIIYPAEPGDWRALADRIAEAVRGLGARDVPIVSDTQAVPERLGDLRADLRAKSLIVLGDLNTNRAVFGLYASYYTCCDALYPGGRGYELRTIVRPFGRDANYLMVGGSTLEGVAAGVQRLVDRLGALESGRDVSLAYCLEVKLGDELADLLAPAVTELAGETAAASKPAQMTGGGGVAAFTRNAHLYYYTGDERFAGLARQAVLSVAASESDEPGLPTGDYTMEDLAAAWRRVSCSPCFSPAERACVDQLMYETAAHQTKMFWRIKPELGIGNRHHTTGGLAFWTLIRVLDELGNPDPRGRTQLDKWYKEAKDYCDGMLRHYWDDEDDYQSADSAQNAASYAMQAGRMYWFDGGLARRAAQRLMMTVDNLGWYAGIQGYGDALPGWERFPLDAGMLLGACAFIHQDGSYLWLLDRFPRLDDSWGSLGPWGLHQFAAGGRLRPVQPSWLAGMQVARLTPYKLDRINSGEFLTTSIYDNFRQVGLRAWPVPADLAFDKLTYRSGDKEQDLYLLMEGSAGTTVTTIDMNTIIRLSDAGKLWLVHNTGRRSLYFKNGVYVGKGANLQPMAPSSELVASKDFGGVALAASRLPDCRGMVWTRNLFILGDRFTGVIDHLRAAQAGDYTLCCGWRTPGFAALKDGRWESRQDDVTFTLLPAVLEGASSERPMQRDGATRPTVLRQERSLKASPGDESFFENVLYASRPDRPRNFAIRRAGPGAIVIRDAGDGSLCLAAAGDRGIRAGNLQSDAAAVLVTPEEIYLIGGSSISVESISWTSDTGRIVLKSDESGKVRSALARLWEAAQTPRAAASSPEVRSQALPAGPKPVWEHAGPATRGGLIDGVQFIKGRQVAGLSLLATDWIMPLLRAEPRLAGRQGAELLPRSAGIHRLGQASAPSEPPAEPVLAPLKGAEFSLELPGIVRVGAIDLFGDTFGEGYEPITPATLSLELTFSKDGFRQDRRTVRMDLPRLITYHNLYKGHCYLFECYRAEALDEEASAIRVRVLDGPGDQRVVTDVQVRSAGGPERQVVEVRPMDLDGDGSDEVLTWTADGDLVVLRPDGGESWRKRFDEGILAIDAWDLDGDARREVFVSRLDRQVDVLNADGSPRWSKDCRQLARESGGRFFGDGSGTYGMAVWRPLTAFEPEVLFTSYWFTTRLTPWGRVTEFFRRAGHFAQICQIPAGMPGAGGLAIRCDIPWPGSVPIQWWDPIIGLPWAENNVPNGRAVFFELGDYDADGQAEALAASEQGVGLYSPLEPKTRWEHMTDAPPIGVGVVQEAAGQPATIVYGRQDGYVFVMSADGRVLRSTVLDEPLQCLTATDAGAPTVWVGTRTSLVGLRLGDLAPMWRQSGSYQKLALQRLPDRQRVLAVTVGGQMAAFDPAAR